MAAPTVADFRARYLQFSSVSDPAIQIAISDAVPLFDEARWGGLFEQGFCAYVAHILTVTGAATGGNGTAAAGPVQSKRVGDVQVAYAAPQFSNALDATTATTVFGQIYLRLRRIVGMGALAV